MLKLVEIGRKVLREEDFKLGQRIFAISVLSPVEKDMALHLKKLETPSPKIGRNQFSSSGTDQVWLKLAK